MSDAEMIALLLPVLMLVQSTGTLLFAKWTGDIEIVDCGAFQWFAWPMFVVLMPIIIPVACYRTWRKRRNESRQWREIAKDSLTSAELDEVAAHLKLQRKR
jgi:hypothetical protein